MNGGGWQRAVRMRGFDRVFNAYLTWLLRRSFATVWLSRNAAPLPSGGYIAAPNHSSWWDGFIGHVLHYAGGDREFAIMMSDRELRRFPFFRWLGAFSVDASSVRAAHGAILYAAAECARGAGVWIFPQGTIVRGDSQIAFTSGFVHAARKAESPIVPVAIRYVMRDRQRPEIFIDVAAGVAPTATARSEVEDLVARMLESIDRAVAQDAVTERFVPFLSEYPGIDARIAGVIERFRRR